MKRILITGATGNVGKPIIDNLSYSNELEVLAGVRAPENDFTDKPVKKVYFDFDDIENCLDILDNLDCLFLLRPPYISNIKKYFKPIIDACVAKNVKQVVFLSVQGADRSSFTPHHKIEQLLLKSGLSYTFLRPGYFMQNLSGPLKYDIVENRRIYIPAGNAKFNWVNANDIGVAAARILEVHENHRDKIYTLTGSENLTFKEVSKQMSSVLNTPVDYISPNPFRFYFNKKGMGLKPKFILILIVLHYLRRFESEPEIEDDLLRLTGEKPTKLKEFLIKNKSEWQRIISS